MDTSTGSQEAEQGKQEFDMTNFGYVDQWGNRHWDSVNSNEGPAMTDSVREHGHLVESELGNSISRHSHADGFKKHDHKPNVQEGEKLIAAEQRAERYKAALVKIHDDLDDQNALVLNDACRFCHGVGHDAQGLKHSRECVILRLRAALAEPQE